MLYEMAKKLHNHDQITVKKTGETTEVISIEVYGKNVYIHAVTKEDGYIKLHHKEIM